MVNNNAEAAGVVILNVGIGRSPGQIADDDNDFRSVNWKLNQKVARGFFSRWRL